MDRGSIRLYWKRGLGVWENLGKSPPNPHPLSPIIPQPSPLTPSIQSIDLYTAVNVIWIHFQESCLYEKVMGKWRKIFPVRPPLTPPPPTPSSNLCYIKVNFEYISRHPACLTFLSVNVLPFILASTLAPGLEQVPSPPPPPPPPSLPPTPILSLCAKGDKWEQDCIGETVFTLNMA